MCPRCKKKEAIFFKDWPKVCKKCEKDPKYLKEQEEKIKKAAKIRSGFSFIKYKDPVAFGVDKKTGQPLAIDKKGKRFDPKDTRYNPARDPHGWKVTGKKPARKLMPWYLLMASIQITAMQVARSCGPINSSPLLDLPSMRLRDKNLCLLVTPRSYRRGMPLQRKLPIILQKNLG